MTWGPLAHARLLPLWDAGQVPPTPRLRFLICEMGTVHRVLERTRLTRESERNPPHGVGTTTWVPAQSGVHGDWTGLGGTGRKG